MNAKMMDVNKAVQNIKSKTIDSPRNNGQWAAVCEAIGCSATTESSKMHDWVSEKWVLCPEHKHLQT